VEYRSSNHSHDPFSNDLGPRKICQAPEPLRKHHGLDTCAGCISSLALEKRGTSGPRGMRGGEGEKLKSIDFAIRLDKFHFLLISCSVHYSPSNLSPASSKF
jgi:hypothetical protein